MENAKPHRCTKGCPWWQLPLLLAMVLGAIVLTRGLGGDEGKSVSNSGEKAEEAKVSSKSEAAPISVTMDFGEGRTEVVADIDWTQGMTVRDAMLASPRIRIMQKGSGEGPFLTQIGESPNEGAGGRNWLYSVNGQQADRSYAVYELRPGDRILWTFAQPQ